MIISLRPLVRLGVWFQKRSLNWVIVAATLVSVLAYYHYSNLGLNLAYNDARSHLNIGRRVVEGLKPGLAQLGSVWLPLPHLLMIPTIGNDFFWHSGLSGSLQSMVSYVAVSALIYLFLDKLQVGLFGRIVAVTIFALNPNILYLQSTAMTELLLLATMTAGCYFLLLWHHSDKLIDLIKSGFFISLSTLVRYDGWFLLVVACGLIFVHKFVKSGWSVAEGTSILFGTLASFGVVLWFGWNLLIFKDPLYFAFGPYSAHSQQAQLARDGVLHTKGDLKASTQTYLLALVYNSTTFLAALGLIGLAWLLTDKRITPPVRLASATLITPLVFNIIALIMGHSVLYVPNLAGNTWFNVRYGVMVVPSIAVFAGYLVDRAKSFRLLLASSVMFVLLLALVGGDAVTIDDGLYGSSQKNVTEVASYLKSHALNAPGFVLISAASHDAIIFSSMLPMKRFIHEGTGAYWESAATSPDRWARWIIMRTNDNGDSTWRLVSKSEGLEKYSLIEHYEFADIYAIKPEYVSQLNTQPIFGKQK